MSKTLTFAQILSSPVAASASAFYEKSHSGSKCQKSANFKFTQGYFPRFSLQVSSKSHNFRFRLPALHIQNLSNHCRHKYDSLISRIF